MTDVKMYYADTVEDVVGREFRGQSLTFVLLNDEKITGKDEESAKRYIHKQDPQIAIGSCRGRQGFQAEVEDRRQTYERSSRRGGEPLVPVVVSSLPSRSRGMSSWFEERRERRAAQRVNALEEQWPTGDASNVETLLGYLQHPSSRIRETAALAIGEYLPVIVEQSGRSTIVDKAVTALLDALKSEASEAVLTNIGTALGNTPLLTTAEALVSALEGRSDADVAHVAKGLSLLRPSEYRTELREALAGQG